MNEVKSCIIDAVSTMVGTMAMTKSIDLITKTPVETLVKKIEDPKDKLYVLIGGIAVNILIGVAAKKASKNILKKIISI